MQEITVNASRKYPVFVGSGAIDLIGKTEGKAMVITQPTVKKYAKQVADALGGDAVTITVPDGEEAKSLSETEKLYSKAIEIGLEKGDTVFSVGGGCVGDAAGFFASTYKRGVRLVHVPTTLLAQVDSSVGGKTAVNFRQTKNMIGTICQPHAVYSDLDTLKTLPSGQMRNGLAEVVKYGVVFDASFAKYVEDNLGKITSKDPETLEEIVSQSVRLKARAVEKDEFDAGERMKLNYGHTIGHAIETTTGMPHGEAISVGMSAAAIIASNSGLLSGKDAATQNGLLQKAGLPLTAKGDADGIMGKITQDKKRSGGKIRMVLLGRIGSCRIEEVGEREICEALEGVLE